MKILYFNYLNDLYGYSIGSTIKAKKLLSNLENLGHSIHYYWRFENTPEKKKNKNNNKTGYQFVRNIFFAPKQIIYNFREGINELKYLRKIKPDLVIIRLDAFRISAALLAKLLKLPALVEADGAMSYEWLNFQNNIKLYKSWLILIERICLEWSSYIFVQSNVTESYYINLYPSIKHKITVITNAADPQSVSRNDHTQIRQEMHIPENGIVCGFLGSLHFWHGTDTLFYIINQLVPANPNLYFVFIGSGGIFADKVQQSCAGYSWSDRVIFIRYVDHEKIPSYLNIIDIAIAPYPNKYLFYYSPMKIFEYMAAAKAVLTTPVGQIKELIIDGQNGLFFNPDELTDLSDKLQLLIDSPELRKLLGENASAMINKGYTWKEKASQLEALCTSAMNNRFF